MAAAAHTFLSFSSPPCLLVSPSSTLRSSFGGVSLNLHRRQSVSFSASSKKSLTVVSAAKKAVAVLKGNSDVEGVVTLTQEDTGSKRECSWMWMRRFLSLLGIMIDVRSGTNPLEGAALEMAILESFAESGSLLTWQPHITESLRCLNTAILAFENACMEFDDLNLKPTFKILWGVPAILAFENACMEFDDLNLKPTFKILWGVPVLVDYMVLQVRRSMRSYLTWNGTSKIIRGF
ncbi:hypothetical protein DY000_02006088 [Brassica cretica]|uniref:Uncharacterized protein n=1 Tax=Brassica cretica TaxID=69181 RepID=A0ABQ7CB65_BRACR|nr:hypothetical protein DY000_02006088 [Brassica cretica]